MKPKSPHTIIIKPQKGWAGINWKELWLYRELFSTFTWRDIKVRYKQTVLGVLWALLQPIVTMVVFSVFFGTLAKMPSDGIPYPIFVYVGLLLWQYFAAALTNASNSMVAYQNMIQKIYFPRLVLPFSAVLTPMIDFAISFVVLIGLMIYYQYMPSLTGILILPLLLILTFMTASGAGVFLASINVKYRDIRYILPFSIQILMFLTPVIYPVSILGKEFQWLLALNPMSGIVEAARAGILGQTEIPWNLLGVSAVTSIFIFFFGIYYFRKTEQFFADIV